MSGGPAASAPVYGIESSFCKAAMARSGSPMRRGHPCEDLDRSGTSQGVFLDRIRGHGPFRQSQRGGLVTETHIGQREIANEEIIFRLFFEETIPVRGAPVANFPGRRHGRRRLLAPSLTKSAVRHCKNPTPDQAWRVFPLAEG